ncbi:MAG: Gx transporter family protein [Lactobacillales bacterium]|nr:Gx transporter family protein [Lactobacillales bacterium]
MDIRKTINFSMLLALSVVLSIFESLIPIINGSIPGLKLGFANIVILFILYRYKFKDAIYLSILRVILVALLRTGFGINFIFSLVGAILSVSAMFIFKKLKFSIITVSVMGSIFHIIGQIITTIILLDTFNLIYYLPYLIIFSVITGFIIGVITNEILERTKEII